MERNEKQTLRMKKEDAALHKTIYWILGAVALELVLLLLNRYYVDYTVSEIGVATGIYTALGILAVAFPVCCAVAAVWAMKCSRAGQNTVLPATLAVAAAVLTACTVLLRFFNSSVSIKVLYIGVPVVAVLAVIYYLYQREFFVNAALCTAGIIALWMIQRGGESHTALVYGYVAVVAVLLAAVVLACGKMKANGGMLTVNGKELEIFSKTANYMMTYVTCALVGLDIIACILLGAMVASMALYAVLVAWLLVMAVYYTVCLM